MALPQTGSSLRRGRGTRRDPATGASDIVAGPERVMGEVDDPLAGVGGALRGVPAERGAAHGVAAGGETSPTPDFTEQFLDEGVVMGWTYPHVSAPT